MSSEDHRGSSESQSFYKDVFEYVQKNMSLEELLSLLTEDEPWENLVTEANLSREEADGLSKCLIKLLTILNRKNQERCPKYQQKKQRFLKEFPQVKQELKESIKKLRELADHVDKVHRDCTISNVVASSTSIASGALGILGLGLAPFTAGLSLGLSAAGIGLGAAATVTGLSTLVVETVNTSSAETQAKCFSKATAKSVSLLKKVKDFAKHIQAIKVARRNPQLLATAQRFINTGRLSVQSAQQVTRNFGGTALAATRAARIRSGVLSGIFIGLDVYSLVKDAQDLQEGAKTASAENMRQEAQELERKLEKLTRIYESLQ
ncbi:apolipoprotein L3-like [Capricornis sumatraensis]|uniref:apolipoprotein L3-like n=1 Tax=Capricornis sumatraensis TaxID=34865 RepID=UPI0036053258